MVPADSIKIAYIVFDSDHLPRRWTDILNNVFDICLVPSPHLIETVRRSLVKIPVGSLPIPLELESLLASDRPLLARDRVRFGSVASFHARKGHDILFEAFAEEFADDSAELVFHSNLSMGRTYDRLATALKGCHDDRITFSHANLSAEDKNSLIASFDVFCNLSRGESYSIGPREALSLGKPIVVSNVGGHGDLVGTEGVFAVEPSMKVPGRYVEIDNLIFGNQDLVSKRAARAALREAYEYVMAGKQIASSMRRRELAQHFTFSRLTTDFAGLIDQSLHEFRRPAFVSRFTRIGDDIKHIIRSRLGSKAELLGYRNKLFVPLFDGGFFSILNAFMSHLVWELQNDRCHAVLPRWSVKELIESHDGRPLTSFCYGNIADDNIWLKIFEPLYDYSHEEMSLASPVWSLGEDVHDRHNAVREAQMTYANAYELYKTETFKRWRVQYNRAFKNHIRPTESLRKDIDSFAKRYLEGHFTIAVHCRHPSHTVEQPDNLIASIDDYIVEVRRQLARRGIDEHSDRWALFLATDQERAVLRFKREFGDRVCLFPDVRRTTEAEDSLFDRREEPSRQENGFQLQHIVAKTQSFWSVTMAHEIVRDAWCMAMCDVLIHVVSNVSTAVAYMNPEIEMIFCEPDLAKRYPDMARTKATSVARPRMGDGLVKPRRPRAAAQVAPGSSGA